MKSWVEWRGLKSSPLRGLSGLLSWVDYFRRRIEKARSASTLATVFRLFPKKSRAEILRERYRQMDFGRVFGWWLCLDGLRVAELNYRRWDSHSQFWHEYYLVPFSEKFDELGTDPDRWCRPDVSAESRYVSGYASSGLLMSPRGDGVVALRGLYVPEEEFVAEFVKIEGIRGSLHSG